MTAKNTHPKLELRDPTKLKPHPVNATVYTDVDDSLAESIRQHGVSEPIQILPDNTILGGHRRREGAIAAGVKYVPVNVRYDYVGMTEDDVIELLIRLNKNRTKTNEQIGREAAILMEIEARRNKPSTREALPAGRTRDVIGKKLGVSGKTAENAAKVVKKIAELEQNGLLVEAEQLREKLDKSVEGAAMSIKPKQQATKFDEMIAGCDWVMKVALGRIQEYAILNEQILGETTFQAGRARHSLKAIDVMFTNAKRVAEHARNKIIGDK